ESMAGLLAATPIREAAVPVVANLTADYETEPSQIKANLAAQIDHPVRWEESIARLVADGFDTFAEIGPGTVLSGLMKRLAPDAQTYSVGDAAGVRALVEALASAS